MNDKNSRVLTVQNLVVGFAGKPDATPLLKGISLDVAPGETLCLVGESGSGKSVTSLTTMGLLPKGVLKPFSGLVDLNGENLLEASPGRLRSLRATKMAMIFQEPMTALNPVLTVGRQIDEVLRNHTGLNAASRKRRIFDILEQVHLPNVERIYASHPHMLSGGQRQRVMIAMALILNPMLLIADEPTTALDVTTQKQILSLIKEMQEKHGTAVLFITHDMGVVADIADRVSVMRHGNIVETGNTNDVLCNPQQDYTRNLLKSVPSLIPRAVRPESDAATALEVKGLFKTYRQKAGFFGSREIPAVADVQFTLKRGRTLGIVGESGSGKSTAARCIARLVAPSAGQIQVGGSDITGLSTRGLRPFRQKIQMIFQDPYRSLNPRLRVGDTIVEGPVNFGKPRGEAMKRALELLHLVGLPADAAQRYPHQFSGGQRQRIAIARALAMEPDVLVADEAVSALDVSVQAQVMELLTEIQQKIDVAVLFITHDLRVAAQLCDDILVMHKGRVVEHGSAVEVLTTPRDAYTRSLIDAAPGRDWDFGNFRKVDFNARANDLGATA